MANFTGTPGDDFFFGTDDPETISGLGGDDFLNGGGGDDLVSGGSGRDDLTGGLGDDTVRGGGGADFLQGGDGGDDLRGGEGDDTIQADSSAVSEFRQDTLRGGGGADQFVFQVTAPGSTINVADVILDFEGAGAPDGDTLLLALPFGEDARLVYVGQNGEFTGGDGLIDVSYSFQLGDTLIFADTNDDGIVTSDDLTILLEGEQALRRSDFGDTAFALIGGPGDDSIRGGEFDDPISGLGGSDTLDGGGGDDQVEGGLGDDSLGGGRENDRLAGGAGADTIDGGADRDFVTGDEGDDSVRGGKDDDNVSGGDGDDLVYGDEGDDNVDGDEGNDTSYGGAGDDFLFAGEDDDLLYGETGEDVVEGGEGDDTMFGGDGDDELIGDEGADMNTGGAGDDEFLFFLGTFAPSSDFGANDTITDFEGAGVAGGDVINLGSARLAFAGEVSIDPEAGTELSGAGDGVTQLVYTQSGGDSWLIADDDDDGVLGTGDFILRVEGIHDFTTDDFEGVDFVIAGSNEADTLQGTSRDDTIFGAGGSDDIRGRGGNDELYGGAGRDTLEGGPGGFDSLFGGAGADLLTLASSDNGGVADGGKGNDTLIGSDIEFSFGQLNGGRGTDELQAGAAGSALIGDDGADRLVSGTGDDALGGGRDENFALDGDRDLFVYGADPWGDDNVSDFEDGVDLFDLTGSGLTFQDLTVDDSQPFQTLISSNFGTITVLTLFEPAEISEADFLFG